MDEIDALLAGIRSFCQARNITEKTFGNYVKNDSRLVGKLRDGRVTIGTAKLIKKYLEDNPVNTLNFVNKNLRENPDTDYFSLSDEKITEEERKKLAVNFLLSALCGHLGVAAASVLDGRHGEIRLASGEVTTAARIRARAAYLLHTSLGLPQTEVAALFGVTKQAISKSLPLIEDEMDDPRIAGVMGEMGRMLRHGAELRS